MNERLSDDEVAELARVFPDVTSAREALRSAGFPMGREPSWSVDSPIAFWTETNSLLANGILPDGRSLIMTLAAQRLGAPGQSSAWRFRPNSRRPHRRRLRVRVMSIVLVPLASVIAYFAVNRSPPAAQLQVDDLVVEQTDSSDRPSQVVVTLHNTSSRRVVVTRAVLTVVAHVSVPVCYQNGELPISADYGVRLPKNPVERQIVSTPVSQQLAPDEADRFALQLAKPADTATHLYRLQLSLQHDGDKRPLTVGEFMVSTPYVPHWEDAQYLSWKDPEGPKRLADLGLAVQARVTSCLEHNTSALEHFFGSPDERQRTNLIMPDPLAQMMTGLGDRRK
ncbi:effector-associated domain EAD1-containing protein [Frankia sp. AgKG'84/4]|uniref:effector-associated domain EAD1-containing protein n=1 Tax=Frankia sp. AgKG'84/4 TaxID=573490 RepID=UPI002010A57E|nr:effector-associated domain EAD1-containing protein [Frankia sp. AgKG'84/4]MCL9794463.1 effector-associated domain EAD1-containing protein [Frankia sp. AgKG'84/4]